MEDNNVTPGKLLLYDPMFDKKPDIEIHDDPQKGIFGKTVFKKAMFIIVLTVFIGISLFMSFYSVSYDKYKFEETENGNMLYEYHGGTDDKILSVDYVCDKNGLQDLTKPVNEVREFAVCCNEYLEYIYIGESVAAIDSTSFYTCPALKAVIVAPGNEHYISIDGVLYEKTDGVPTKIILYPALNGYYRQALTDGADAPGNTGEITAFMDKNTITPVKTAEDIPQTAADYEIPDTVTVIGELSFAACDSMKHVKIPDGVTVIETMAFFKCTNLNDLYLPDGLTFIGSDAFSSCKSIDYLFIPSSVTEIGHHAFNNCTSLTQVNMGHPDKSGIKFGEQWAPQTRKMLMVSVEVLYSQTREEK